MLCNLKDTLSYFNSFLFFLFRTLLKNDKISDIVLSVPQLYENEMVRNLFLKNTQLIENKKSSNLFSLNIKNDFFHYKFVDDELIDLMSMYVFEYLLKDFLNIKR